MNRKNFRRRFISFILILIMVIGILPLSTVNVTAEFNIPSDVVEFNGHYYKFYINNDKNVTPYRLTLDEAIEYCESMGGHLATITSKEENDFLYSYIISLGQKNAYFGLIDRGQKGNWKWVTGESVVYTNWAKGEPNRENPREIVAMFYQKFTDGKWNDGDFSAGCPFICEWDYNINDIPANAIHIKTAEQLASIGGADSKGKYYVLDNDINLTKEWVPIDDFFGATFDGQGYSINNLYVLKESKRQKAGLFGTISGDGRTIKNVCINIGKQGVNAFTDVSSDFVYAGGIIGDCLLLGKIIIENCYVTGNISSTGYYSYAGGLIGRCDAFYDDCTLILKNCYTIGNIFATTSDVFASAGGLIGICQNIWFTQEFPLTTKIENCYAAGDVSAIAKYGYAGGLIGEEDISQDSLFYKSIINSYRLSTQTIKGKYINTSGTPLTSAQMKNKSSFVNWDFNTVWAIDPNINEGYPYLRKTENNSGTNKIIKIPIRSFIKYDEEDKKNNKIPKNKNIGDEKEFSYDFKYSDNFFIKSSYEYNHDLARMSLGMAIAGYSTVDSDKNWGKEDIYDRHNTYDRDKNILDVYKKIGFDKNSYEPYNYNISLNDSTSKVAFTIAKKEISLNDNKFILVAVVLRGGGYGSEWADNANVGNNGAYHEGFYTAAREVENEIKKYILALKGNVEIKLWITGYSRSAGVANLVAAKMDKWAEDSKTIKATNIYTYTFATPNVVIPKSDKQFNNKIYKNIFNIINPHDIVPTLPLSQWEFSRYGVSRSFSQYNSKSMMLLDDYIKKQKEYYDKVEIIYNEITKKTYNISQAFDQNFKVKDIDDLLYKLSPSTNKFSKNWQIIIGEFLKIVNNRKYDNSKKEWVEHENILSSFIFTYPVNGVNVLKEVKDYWDKKNLALILSTASLKYDIDVQSVYDTILVITAFCKINNIPFDEVISDITQFIDFANLLSLLTIKNNFSNNDLGNNIMQAHFPEVYISWMFAHDENVLFEN